MPADQQQKPPIFGSWPTTRTGRTAAAGPVGASVGFQAGVAANPANVEYKRFLDSVTAQQRRGQAGGAAGERIFR